MLEMTFLFQKNYNLFPKNKFFKKIYIIQKGKAHSQNLGVQIFRHGMDRLI